MNAFFSFSDVDIRFVKREIIWRRYTTLEVVSTTKKVELINKKKFAIKELDIDNKTFVVYITALDTKFLYIHNFWVAQIWLLKVKEALTLIPAKYSDYTDIFLSEFTVEIPEYISINDYSIKLKENKQPLYSIIYSLRPLELETLKAYIKINLTNSFIKPSKSPSRVLIFFDCKPNRSFCLCVNYCGLNNLIIKN